MTEYIIKSAISLTFLYVLFSVFLRNIKTFKFNRFYLLFTVIFSLIIPFVTFSTGIKLPLSQNIHNYSSSISSISIQQAENKTDSTINFFYFLLMAYILIASILFIRFVFNLYKIIKTITNSKKSDNGVIRLSPVKNSPYSFFNYIILNQVEYEKGEIKDDLILHEQAHCKQYHSIDIIFIEIIKIIYWFNPVVWLIKQEILLNHEYYADNEVLQTQNTKTYQNTLLNVVFRNNTTYLASNFNFSLTKRRLIMMTKNNSLANTMVRRIAVVPFVLLMSVTLTFSQKNGITDSLFDYKSEWWFPIIEKHNLKMSAYNNFKYIFEMGTTNSINDRVVTLTDAVFIIRQKDNYYIIKSPLAYHDLDKNIISGDDGSIETFKYEADVNTPIEKLESKGFKFEFNKNEPSKWTAEKVEIVAKKETASFQETLAEERKAAAEEQNVTFQKKLTDERKAAAEEQNETFQKKLADERKAAAEGKIVNENKKK